MKQISQLFFAWFILFSSACLAGPTQQAPGLLSAQYAKSIKPTDFNAGPVIITEPGYYILTNDIIFSPANPFDEYGNPFKAALIILADCVTIDLNTHSIQQNRAIIDSTKFKLIELGGKNIFNLQDPTNYAPKHVTIKNGCLSNSQGYGIYGKNNSNAYLYDLSIGSCDSAGIFLQNLQCSKIEDVCVSGSPLSTGNAYGIFLRDNATGIPDWTSNSSGTSGPSGVTLENVKICDIFTNSSLNTENEIVDLLCMALNKLNISTLCSLQNCVDPSIQNCIPTFKMVINQLITLIECAKISPIPANIDQIIAYKNSMAFTSAIQCFTDAFNNLINPTEADLLFIATFEQFQAHLAAACDYIDQANALSSGQKDFINGVETTTAWHAYGIRVTNGNGIELKNCFATGTQVNPEVTDVTRAVAIALDKCNGCTLTDCFTNTSSLNLGSAIGFSLATASQGNYLTNCISTSHKSGDQTYGYWLCGSDCQNFLNCEASSNKSTSTSSGNHPVTITKGFYLELCNTNHFKNCKSYSHSCSLNASGDPGEAIGFDSVIGNCNVFDECQAHNMIADRSSANNSYQTNLLAAGFSLIGNTNSVITNSVSRCNEGSGGNSVGIFLDESACSTIKKNTVATNSSAQGNGYGIYDTAPDTTSLIIENLAYANQTFNYKVSYSLENEKLPVVQSTYGDMTSVLVASPWQNISLHANPGSTGCNPECMPNEEQSL